MAGPTYSLHAIVLLQDEAGRIGFDSDPARRGWTPGARCGQRRAQAEFPVLLLGLEIFAEVEALMASGKSLDIVKEVRLVDAHQGIVFDAQHAAACAPVVDLASRLTQPDLASPKMFALLSSALGRRLLLQCRGGVGGMRRLYAEGLLLRGISPRFRSAASAAESPCLYRARKRRETPFCFLRRKGAWSVRDAFCSRMRSAFPSRSYRGRISCLCRRSTMSWLQGLRAGLYLKYCISANLGCASMWVPA